jgi:hypothetical protein
MVVGSTSLGQMLFVTSSGQLSYDDMGRSVNQCMVQSARIMKFLESMHENVGTNIALIVVVSVRKVVHLPMRRKCPKSEEICYSYWTILPSSCKTICN